MNIENFVSLCNINIEISIDIGEKRNIFYQKTSGGNGLRPHQTNVPIWDCLKTETPVFYVYRGSQMGTLAQYKLI